MYCVYCNHPLKGDEKECPSCGRPAGTFVQIEAFRNGKGQKAAAAALPDLALSESPEVISAKIVSMGKEIKALRKENEGLKKEQAELRALIEECRTMPGTREIPDDGGRGSKRGGGLLSAVLTAAIAALIPLVALVIIYTGLSKKNADLEQKLLGTTNSIEETTKRLEETEASLSKETEASVQHPADVMDEKIGIAQKNITNIQDTLDELKTEVENLRKIIRGEDVTEEPAEESVEKTEAPAGDTSEEISEETAPDTSEKISEESVRNPSEEPSGETPADTYAGNPDENTEQYAPHYPGGYPAAGYPAGI